MAISVVVQQWNIQIQQYFEVYVFMFDRGLDSN